MLLRIFIFSKLNVSTVSLLRINYWVMSQSLSDSDMKMNLEKFKQIKDSKVGDNYMKKANLYFWGCLFITLFFVIILIIFNSDVNLRDLLSFRFVINQIAFKTIINQICVTGLVIGIFAFLFAVGLRKKKYEDITVIKKYALHSFIYCLHRQKSLMSKNNEGSKIESLWLFINFIKPALELKNECDKIVSSYDNLLKTWELDDLCSLQSSVSAFISSVCMDVTALSSMDFEEFQIFFKDRIEKAPQNEKINVYLYDVEKQLKQYMEKLNICVDDFKAIS